MFLMVALEMPRLDLQAIVALPTGFAVATYSDISRLKISMSLGDRLLIFVIEISGLTSVCQGGVMGGCQNIVQTGRKTPILPAHIRKIIE